MLRRTGLWLIAGVAMLLLSACAQSRVLTQAEMQANRIATAPLVEAAVSQPMAELYVKAKAGGTRDKIIFSLALDAGRDTSALPDPAITPANIARAEALERHWYLSRTPLPEALSPQEVRDWVVMTRRHMFHCVPCEPPPAPEGDTDAGYAAYVTLHNADRWRWQPGLANHTENFAASTCVWSIATSLRTEAAARWLEKDLVTATGRRQVLDGALHAEMIYLHREMGDMGCLEGRFEAWREQLRANRPELDAQMAAFLEQRVGDPRDPRLRRKD